MIAPASAIDLSAIDPEIDDFDLLRAHEYNLLATLLGRSPDRDLLSRLVALRGDQTPLGSAHMRLARAAAETRPNSVECEFFDLFIGVGRGELLPYASYYLTGFLNERPLAQIRAEFDALGIERTPDQREPEDHIAILLETMAGLACRRFAASGNAEQGFFERHLKPWAERFFGDLETAQSARFYRAVGTLGRSFIEIETQAFAME